VTVLGLRLLLLTLVVGLAGCTIGPSTMNRDRFDYSQAVVESWKSQMLINLVRIRYGDGEHADHPGPAAVLHVLFVLTTP